MLIHRHDLHLTITFEILLSIKLTQRLHIVNPCVDCKHLRFVRFTINFIVIYVQTENWSLHISLL